MARLRDQYFSEIRPQLKEQLGIENDFAVPRLQKISLSCGVGGAKDNKKLLEHALGILERVSGQKAVSTRARKSIAQFRLRQGMYVGARVTLRGARMYEFLDRFVNVVAPRIRDFRGLKRKLDGRGNYSVGLAEQSVFPEVDGELLENPQGMNITFTMRSQSDEHSIALLRAYNFPFRREEASIG
ncbi:MAG: 50S ribosomal protein L5 [Planctomycetota bacterium]|nr:50S ribosomal protein L5 [Planctomycetota bacterium]